MDYNLRSAIVDLKKHEEPGVNYIYAKTYNYVYLRAKSILRRENDVLQLMQDVYVKMIQSSADIEVENLYEWLGECTYRMGCGYYRKKKTREADLLELDEKELGAQLIEYPEATAEVVAKSLEELPDLYQATFYAFYYDYMSIGKISKLMECSKGVIINRLNYTKKYMTKALANRKEETGINVFFSVEGICMALRKWSVDNCIGMIVAQNVYTDICKNADIQPAPVYLEGKEFAGAKNTVVFHRENDYEFVKGQMEKYGRKLLPNKMTLMIFGGVAVLVVIIALVIWGISDAKKDKSEEKKEITKVEEQQKEDTDFGIEDSEEDDLQEEVPEEPSTPQANASEYIFPDSNTRELSSGEIEARSAEELRLGINEIYARHGVIFGASDLDAYFRAKSWYQPKISLEQFEETGDMTTLEYNNISAIDKVYQRKLEQ